MICSDEAFKMIVVGCMRYYSYKTHMRIKEVWDMMFGEGAKFKDVLDDRYEATCCIRALMESLTC